MLEFIAKSNDLLDTILWLVAIGGLLNMLLAQGLAECAEENYSGNWIEMVAKCYEWLSDRLMILATTWLPSMAMVLVGMILGYHFAGIPYPTNLEGHPWLVGAILLLSALFPLAIYEWVVFDSKRRLAWARQKAHARV